VAPYLILALLALAGGVTAWVSSRATPLSVGPEGVVIYHVADLAPATTTRSGAPVDGLTCRSAAHEVVTYHTHVTIYVNGQLRRLPAGIGITPPALVVHYPTGTFYDVGTADCLYWLHTHVADGIIHIEAPRTGNFTLGQFFDVWGQPLNATRVATASGPVVVYENGRRLTGDPRRTPLLAQGDIQIDVGTPAPVFQPFTFRVTGGCGQGTLSCAIPAS
jgi:hypothetical protein